MSDDTKVVGIRPSTGPWRWGYVGEDGHVFEHDLLLDAEGNTVGVVMRDYDQQKQHKNNFAANVALIADAPAMLELLRKWATGSATWQDLADARALVLLHVPGTKLHALPDPPSHPAVALLAEAMNWLEDPSAYAQDRAREFDERARSVLGWGKP